MYKEIIILENIGISFNAAALYTQIKLIFRSFHKEALLEIKIKNIKIVTATALSIICLGNPCNIAEFSFWFQYTLFKFIEKRSIKNFSSLIFFSFYSE